MPEYLYILWFIFQLAVGFLSNYEAPDVTEILLDGKSTSLWGISPPSRKSLIEALESNMTEVQMEFHITFTRFVYHLFTLITFLEPSHKKTCLWGFRPGPTQTGLYRHRIWLEA